jgi:hypothetical protein
MSKVEIMICGRLYSRALAIGACLALAACAGAQVRHGGGQGRPVPGGAATFALPPAAAPNWIMPISLPGFRRAAVLGAPGTAAAGHPPRALPVSGAPVTVRLSQLGDRAVTLGAAGLVPVP